MTISEDKRQFAYEIRDELIGDKHAVVEFNSERYSYPDYCERVGFGKANCELVLIFGSKYVAMVDVGMAYCAPVVMENVETALKKRGRDKVDMVLLSHSHYDHMGALPYFIKRWPDIQVYASEKTAKVFESQTARRVMGELADNAKRSYYNGLFSNLEIITEPLKVDHILKEGDRVEIGEKPGEMYFTAFETGGHTDCSMSYGLEPEHMLFASESTGNYQNHYYINSSILKSFPDAMASAEKCKAYDAKIIMSPHYGRVPSDMTKSYFDLYINSATRDKDIILRLREKASSFEELLEMFKCVYWCADRKAEQPEGAFLANATPIIKTVLKDFDKAF